MQVHARNMRAGRGGETRVWGEEAKPTSAAISPDDTTTYSNTVRQLDLQMPRPKQKQYFDYIKTKTKKHLKKNKKNIKMNYNII